MTRNLRSVSGELVLAASIIAGIVLPPVSSVLRPYLFVFVFFLMLFSLMTVELRSALPDRDMSTRLAKVIAWQMVILPAAIGLWHRFVPGAGHWSELMFITACGGTIFGATAFARVMHLDTLLTLRGIILGTLVMPLVLLLLVPLVTQRTAGFDFSAYAARLCIFIVVPIVAAAAYQSKRRDASAGETRLFGRLTLFFLALFGIAIMDGIGARLVHQPWSTLGLLVFALAVHGVFFGLSVLVFRRWGRREALTAGLLSGYRNLAVVLAVGGSLLPPDFVTYTALWQIPMYVTPLIVRYVGKNRQATG